MSIDPSQWRGYFAASPTPFTESGELDVAAFKATLAWFVNARPHGVVVNGTTGEWFAQIPDERREVVELARDAVPATLPLLVGISSTLPEESFALGRHAHAAGADGVLLTIPPSRRLTDREIVDFYTRAAAQVPLPLLIYNVPGVTGFDLPPALIGKLQSIDGVVGVKDNTPSLANRLATLRTVDADRAAFSDVLEPESFEVFAQEGRGRGQIGSAMPLGHELAQAFEHVWAGRLDAARRTVARFSRFKSEVLALLPPGQPWHAQIKALMFASGVDAGFPRFPSRSIRNDADAMSRLRRLMSAYLDGHEAAPMPETSSATGSKP